MALAPPLLVLVGAWSGDGAGLVLDRRAATGPMRGGRGAGQSAGTGHRRDVRRAVRGDLDRLGVGHAAVRSAGIYALAAIVGVSDIDPFVLNLAQGDPAQITVQRRRGRHPGGRVVEQPGEGGVCDCVFRRARARIAPAALAVLAACGIAAAVVR